MWRDDRFRPFASLAAAKQLGRFETQSRHRVMGWPLLLDGD
jgi:hypothetical protein